MSVRERPSRTPIGELGAVVDWSHAAATMQHADGARRLRTLIEALDDDLRALGHADLARGVLHGDPTAHNVLADGDPLRPCGLIDFDLAYHDPLAADIAFAMWRSGRPSPDVPRIDPDRLRAFVAGYCTVRPLDDVERAAIPVYLRARGLQMVAKRTRLRVADNGPLEQVRWIGEHHDQLVRSVQAA
jgi:Ser/Thr protein kinase RdoA (MazF antagonist)